jgi:fructuronate reductase
MRPSIVHIGPGAFHQAHQAFYCHEVLATGAPSGGIRAVSLRSDTLHRALTRQQHEYSLLERDNERYQLRRITSICDTASVQSDGIEAVLERLTDPDVNIATLTVTEKGYCAVATTGALDTLRPEIAHDIAHPTQPCSMPGFLVEALARRRACGLAPLTVCSCDNLPSNGPATRRVVSELAEHRGGDLADWIRGSVAFPASMVDRMVPAPTDAVRAPC